MPAFLVEHRKKIAAAVGVLLLCSLSFALGRFGTAERVVYQDREKIVEVEKVVEVEVEKIVEKKVYVDNTKTRTKVVVVEAPDGTKTSTTDIAVDNDVKNTETKVEEKIVYVDRVNTVEVEKEVFVDKTVPMPDWRLGVLAGIDPLTAYEKGEVTANEAYVGVELQRRLVGPVYGGLLYTFNGTNYVGVSLGLEF